MCWCRPTLPAPNAASTPRLRQAFRFHGKIIETGYPRNDALNDPNRDTLRASVRRQLGLGDDVTAILYAPTWRDDDYFAEGSTPALITDYSSVMFDVAVTGKPIVFHAYDLGRYAKAIRGFYFELIAEAPGPITRTDPDLAWVLPEIDRVQAEYADRYQRFQATYCHLEDGHATDRVLSQLGLYDAACDGHRATSRQPRSGHGAHSRVAEYGGSHG